MIFQYEGAHAVLSTTSYALTGNAAAINGTKARLELAGTFYRPTSLRVIGRDGTVLDSFDGAVAGNGLRFQAGRGGPVPAGRR